MMRNVRTVGAKLGWEIKKIRLILDILNLLDSGKESFIHV
jgi:hypothetical protein